MLSPNDKVTFKDDKRIYFYKGSEVTDNQTEVLMFETKDGEHLRLTRHEVDVNIHTLIPTEEIEDYHGTCCKEGC